MKTPLPDSLQALLVVIVFVMPGFISTGSSRLALPRRQQTDSTRVLHAITFSSINYAIWSPVLWWAVSEQIWEDREIVSFIILLTVLLFSPTLIGLYSARIMGSGHLSNIIHHLTKLPKNQPIDSAWEWFHQSNHRCRYWVRVTLKNEHVIQGIYGYKSFAGSNLDGGEKDLYLEATCDTDWDFLPETAGVYIKESDILLIEFLTVQEPKEATKHDRKTA